MSTDDDRAEMIARFVEHWRRAARRQEAWRSWQPTVPARAAAPGTTEREPSSSVPVGRDTGPVASGVEPTDRGRLDVAARWARLAYPGPIGELIEREISVHVSFGFRFEKGDLISRLADEVLASTLPDELGPPALASPTAARSGKEQ